MISIFRGQPKFQANPESYNGAVRENYSWSQDYMDVEVRVFVSKSVLKGRQVNTHTHSHRDVFTTFFVTCSSVSQPPLSLPAVLRSVSACSPAASKCVRGMGPRRKR